MDKPQFQKTVEELVIINHIEKINLGSLQLTKKIGEGGQAKVYKGTYKDKQIAIKVLQNVDYKCFAHELVIIANLEHANIPKFYGIVIEPNLLSLVFEFIDGKNLDEFKPSDFSNEQKLKIIYELASCIEYIHKNKFIHRDLKPENLMLGKDGHIYLIDFGIAKVITKEDYTVTRAKGTINYLSPECLDPTEIGENEQIISTITPKVDVWAFGCIVSWLFSGFVPWTDKFKDMAPIIQQVLVKKIPFSIPKNINIPNVIQVIKMACEVDLDKRATMSEIKSFLESNKMGC
jgi:serine/threonine protein kinase